MTHAERPGAIDSRLVFRVYAAAALPIGIVTYLWPLLPPLYQNTPAWIVRMRVTAAVITALGCCASAFAVVDDPLGRRRGLLGFAHAHLMLGVMLGIQAWAQWDPVVAPSPLVAWTAATVGVVLMYLAISGPGIMLPAALPALASDHAPPPGGFVFAIRNKRSLLRLRSAYETEIRNAARQEERARLARDLHDAVKQQLFVIQTAGATAQARFDTDPPGARAAVEQVRTAAREAMTEMEAMLDQLQSAPISNAGLVAFLRKQCEAIGFRTGASISFEPGALPDDRLLDPGARQAVARVAQESLSNVARHARARNVQVSLGTSDGSLVLTVRDDGAGFTPGQRPQGMGMANLAARAADVGASLDVSSVPGTGTTVRFAVPCGEPPSPRVYAIRAAVWIGVLLAARVTTVRFGGIAPELGLMVMVIAAIAAVRYSLAAYDVGRRRA
jgi:signal transduction histidine kinase